MEKTVYSNVCNGNKRRKIFPDNNISVIIKKLCDRIIFQLKARLQCKGYLEAGSLVNLDKSLVSR